MYGFVNRNLEELWIDPHDYQPELYEATEVLFTAGMNVSIYNHQLCVLNPRLGMVDAARVSLLGDDQAAQRLSKAAIGP
jgi:hypothetical protein